MKAKATPERNGQLTTALGGVVSLIVAYAFISRALHTGSYWQYLGFLVFLILGVKLFARTFKK
jgi:predicted tellurium resistance membrane protein TerC